MFFIIIFVTLFNIFAWLLFFRKFKKIFTTDNIIENTKLEVNKILIDLNNNADRNISIINDKISNLKKLIDAADKKIKLLDDIDIKNRALADFKASVSAEPAVYNFNPVLQKAAAAYNVKTIESPLSEKVLDESAENNASQKKLLTEDNHNLPKNYSYAKGGLNSKVVLLFDSGMSVEEIAAELSCSTTEVQFILTLENRS